MLMTEPSTNGTRRGLRPSHVAVLDAFEQHGSMTDEELTAAMGGDVRSLSPRRRELADLGYLESVEKRKTSRGRDAAVWRLVPPERIAEVRERMTKREPRSKK